MEKRILVGNNGQLTPVIMQKIKFPKPKYLCGSGVCTFITLPNVVKQEVFEFTDKDLRLPTNEELATLKWFE